MRKPYPHIQLSCDECCLLDYLATKSGVDGWFSLTTAIDNKTLDTYTLVYDVERNKVVSLQFGVRLLLEGISYGYCDIKGAYNLSNKELKMLEGIVKKLNLGKYF